MALSDKQMQRLEALSQKASLTDAEMAELESLESGGTPYTSTGDEASVRDGERRVVGFKRAVDPEAAYRGFGKGASLGFTDRIAGLARAAQGAGVDLGGKLWTTDVGRNVLRQLMPELQEMSNAEIDAALADATGEAHAAFGTKGNVLTDYRAGRDEMEADEAKLKARSPWQFGASEVAGALAGTAAFPGPGAKVAGAGPIFRGAQFAKAAIPVGVAMGAGDSKADLTKGQLKEFIDDLVASGELAGITAAGTGPTLEGLGGLVKKFATNRARAAMKPNSGDLGRLERLGLTDELPNDLLESGTIRPFQTTEGLGEAVGEALEKRGAAQGAAVDAIDAAAGGKTVQPDYVVERIEQDAVAPLRKQASTSSQALADKAQREADIIREMYGGRAPPLREPIPGKKPSVAAGTKGALRPAMSLKDSEELIKRAHSEAADRFYTGKDTEAAEAAKNVYSAVKRANEDAAAAFEASMGPEAAGRFQKTKADFGRMAEAARILAKSNPRLAANKAISTGEAEFGRDLADAVLPAKDVPSGFANTMLGAALGGISSFAGKRANSTAAWAANQASKMPAAEPLTKAAVVAALRKLLAMDDEEMTP